MQLQSAYPLLYSEQSRTSFTVRYRDIYPVHRMWMWMRIRVQMRMRILIPSRCFGRCVCWSGNHWIVRSKLCVYTTAISVYRWMYYWKFQAGNLLRIKYLLWISILNTFYLGSLVYRFSKSFACFINFFFFRIFIGFYSEVNRDLFVINVSGEDFFVGKFFVF